MSLPPQPGDDQGQRALVALYQDRASVQPLILVGNTVGLVGLIFQAVIACSLPVMIFLLYQLLAEQYTIRDEVRSNTARIEDLSVRGITILGDPARSSSSRADRPAPGIPEKKARHESAGKSSFPADRTPRERESSSRDPAH
jgi:hypothetical protein